jgi:ribosomal-protein-alanine N-acetyltransferase
LRPELCTDLCRLRGLRPDDAQAVFANYARDPQVVRYLLWPAHRSPRDAEAFVQGALERDAFGREWFWALTLPGADECVGMISVRPGAREAEIGYVLARHCWGRGIMTAAARAVVAHCFSQAGLRRVWATCAVANPASARVLEKIGLRREGLLRRWHVFPNVSTVPLDCVLYWLSNDDTAESG